MEKTKERYQRFFIKNKKLLNGSKLPSINKPDVQYGTVRTVCRAGTKRPYHRKKLAHLDFECFIALVMPSAFEILMITG